MPSLDREQMRRLVAEARVARLATVDAAGRPHLVPVCFVLEVVPATDADIDCVYIAVDHKPKRGSELRRTANLRATGRASLLIDHYDEDWSRLWWVRLDGSGAPLDHPGEASRVIDTLAAKYPQYRTDRPDGPVLRIEVTGYRGWSATPLDSQPDA